LPNEPAIVLINSVILVLREVLEAAILISVLVTLSLNLRCGLRWFLVAIPLGLLGSVALAFSLRVITDALDGAGQEVVNAALQLLVYSLAVVIVGISAGVRTTSRPSVFLNIAMAVAVASTMTREGSEILIYITGFSSVQEYRLAVYAGSAIGAGIGLSAGVLVLSLLRSLDADRAKTACLLLVALIGSGMVMQSAMLLAQVDWLPSGRTVWDSSALVSEESVTGELLYAVFGYESRPGLVQISLYFSSLLLTFFAYWLGSLRRSPDFEH
jgi:high-affinity iron transporter